MMLGEILVQRKLVAKRELEIALDEQKSSGDFLGSILIRRRYVKEDDLLKVLSDVFKVPFLKLKNEYINWDLAMRFPTSLVVERQCLPFKETDSTLTVAILNPLDAMTISRVEEQEKFKKVNLVLVTAEDMREAIKNYEQRVAAKIKKLLEG